MPAAVVRAAVRPKRPPGVNAPYRRRKKSPHSKRAQSERRRLTRETLLRMAPAVMAARAAVNGDDAAADGGGGDKAWRRCAARLYRLLNHARNERVRANGRDGFTVDEPQRATPRRYTGLTKRLHALFWPDSVGNPRSKDARARRAPAALAPGESKLVRTCATSGAEHGTLVHDQLRRAVAHVMRLGAQKGAAAFARECRTPDPCVLRVLSVCERQGWTPVASELPLWNEDWRVATAIDLLCVDVRRSRLVLVELKNGFEGEEYGPHATDARMRAPLDDLRDCPMHRHQLQLLAMRLMLSERYGVDVDESCVVLTRSKRRDTLVIGEDPWCAADRNRRTLYAALQRGAGDAK